MEIHLLDIIYIFFGWLLGLLSPSIVQKISEKSEKRNLKKIIFNDLEELKKRLSPLPFQIYPRYGKLDKAVFEWLKINSSINFSDGLEKISEEGHTEEVMLDYINTKGQQKRPLYFKKMHLFAIDSHLINFGIIEDELVGKILEVKFYIKALNEDIDNYRENLNMTFLPGITSGNYEIISQQIDTQSLMIAERSIHIVDKINSILEAREGSK